MAIKRKTRKTGAKKRKPRVGATASKTVTRAGKRYTVKACGLTKTAAQARAKNHKAKGSTKLAITVQRPGRGWCVATRG